MYVTDIPKLHKEDKDSLGLPFTLSYLRKMIQTTSEGPYFDKHKITKMGWILPQVSYTSRVLIINS